MKLMQSTVISDQETHSSGLSESKVHRGVKKLWTENEIRREMDLGVKKKIFASTLIMVPTYTSHLQEKP